MPRFDIYATVAEVDDRDRIWDEIWLDTLGPHLEGAAKAVTKRFNDTARPGENHRVLISCRPAEPHEKVSLERSWKGKQ